MKEEFEVTSVIVNLAQRIAQLESLVQTLQRDRVGAERPFVSVEQLDELTTKVEQNITRKLRERMGEQ